MITMKILNKGDDVISINEQFLAIKRKNGEVDIYKTYMDDNGLYVDPIKISTIGFGTGIVEKTLDDGKKKIVSF